MLTDKEKIDILNDKISELENYILELETAMDNNEIHESQIVFVNNILLEERGSVKALKSLLQEINLNAIIWKEEQNDHIIKWRKAYNS